MQLTDRVRVVAAPGQPRAPGAVGMLVAAAALALGGGPVGLAVGAGLVLVGMLASATGTFALGQAALLAVRPGLAPFVAAEAGLFLLLLVSTPSGPADRTGTLAAALFVVLGVAAWVGATQVGVLGAAVGLVVAAALASYLLHRYERVVLGLAGGEEA